MMQVINEIYDEEIELLKEASLSAKDKYLKKKNEINGLKQDFETKSVRLVSLSENEQENRAALIKNGVPQCPRCVVISNDFHNMSPQKGDDKHDYFSCKSCGLQVEIKI